MQAGPTQAKKDDDETRPLMPRAKASSSAEDLGASERGVLERPLIVSAEAAKLLPLVLCLGLIPGTASSFYLSSVGYFTDLFHDKSLFSDQLFLVFGSAVPIFAVKFLDDHLDHILGTHHTVSFRIVVSSVVLSVATAATALVSSRIAVHIIGLTIGFFSFAMISTATEIAIHDAAACGTWLHTGVAIGSVFPKIIAPLVHYGPKASLTIRIFFFGMPALFCGMLSIFLCGIVVVAMRELRRLNDEGGADASASRSQSVGVAFATVCYRMQPAPCSIGAEGSSDSCSESAAAMGAVRGASAAASAMEPAGALLQSVPSEQQQVPWFRREPFLEFQAVAHAFTGMVASFFLLSFVPSLGSADLAQRLYLSKVGGDFLGRVWVSILWGAEPVASSLRIPVPGHLIIAGLANKVRVSLCLFLVLPVISPSMREAVSISDTSKQFLFTFIFGIGAAIGSWLEAVLLMSTPLNRRQFTGRCLTIAHFGGLLTGLIIGEAVRIGGHVNHLTL